MGGGVDVKPNLDNVQNFFVFNYDASPNANRSYSTRLIIDFKYTNDRL